MDARRNIYLFFCLTCLCMAGCLSCTDNNNDETAIGTSEGYQIAYTPTSPTSGETVTFYLANVTDGSLSVSWNFGDGTFVTALAAEEVNHAFGDAGSYTVRAYLSPSGSLTELSTTVNVADSDAAMKVSNIVPARMEKVMFTINEILGVESVLWDFGDGSDTQSVSSPTETVTHQYDTYGTYTATAVISFSGGVVVNLTQDITVSGESLSYSCLNFDRDKMWIMAHRGNYNGGNVYPPNSLTGFRKVVEDGYAEFIELDCQLTKDDVVVLIHDNYLSRFTNYSNYASGNGMIADFTYDEIKQYRLKTTDGTVTNEIVPTLEEVLTELGDKIFFSIDKVADSDITTTSLAKIYEVVRKCGCLDRAHFQVGNTGNTNAGWLSQQTPQPILMPFANSNNQLSTMLVYSPYYIIGTSTSTVVNNISWLATINANGLSVVNVLDDYQDNFLAGNTTVIDSFVSAGLNIVQTDYPEQMHEYLQKKGKR